MGTKQKKKSSSPATLLSSSILRETSMIMSTMASTMVLTMAKGAREPQDLQPRLRINGTRKDAMTRAAVQLCRDNGRPVELVLVP